MTLGPFVYCQVHRRTVPLSEAVQDESTGLYTCEDCKEAVRKRQVGISRLADGTLSVIDGRKGAA